MRDASDSRRVRLVPGGPLLVEGPVTVAGHDGVAVTSERFMVAVCTCRRSRRYPWCDTSHRSRATPPARTRTDGATDPESGATA
ncbi:CDGSH iron-sulfur domain-containing protein [Streptomyces sp. NBC_00385]|uniref:CDGSH iron-sulfur domain-containing protein n=1 Tax=Streptomyces sp. NBC_00385 TaxID=2975733 RepID=UPI002DD9D4FB|nr:CDGSH iron-sulfur domain-containing protein [Streptomyces sp. NBC_00385]WRZ02458.1 CDGSH iron-sulfur domain-containing protein [Streptomyces sp. NBC_00385]